MTRFALTDCHCHLQDDRFDRDLSEVMARAELAGVWRLVCNASVPSDWKKTVDIAQKFPNVFPCLGLHPLYVEPYADANWLDLLSEMLAAASQKLPQPVAIGEIGLDRYLSPRGDALQESVFRDQLWLATRLAMPVMLHTRHAVDRTIEILAEKNVEIPVFLLHGFSGSTERLEKIVAMGGYFSFSANILKIHHKKMRHAAATVPLDRVLLESDAPDMPPPVDAIPSNWSNGINEGDDIADKSTARVPPRNEPAILTAVLDELARLRGMPVGELAAIIAENEAAFFKKW